MGLLWQTDDLTKGDSIMQKVNIIIGAAILAALLLLLGILIWRHSQPVETAMIDIETPAPTPTGDMSTNIIIEAPEPTIHPMPTEILTPTESPQITEAPIANLFCTLTIEDEEVEVLNSVEEEMLKQHPGWLPSSAMPGEDGMCVVYGHRNRNHLRVLEDVKNGDTITVTMVDGVSYKYVITNITIYDSAAELQLPAVDGSTLVLVTCYPFRYSGNAPGKYMVTAVLSG